MAGGRAHVLAFRLLGSIACSYGGAAKMAKVGAPSVCLWPRPTTWICEYSFSAFLFEKALNNKAS